MYFVAPASQSKVSSVDRVEARSSRQSRCCHVYSASTTRWSRDETQWSVAEKITQCIRRIKTCCLRRH